MAIGYAGESEAFMRRVRYCVAASLDGYIAGPHGEIDWIAMDPEIDFAGMLGQFDTVLMGRRTYEDALRSGNGSMPGMKIYVFSQSLQTPARPDVTVVARNLEQTVAGLRGRSGKDIWLFGGGTLFRSMAEARLVDSVEVTIIPILLGGGQPLLKPPAARIELEFKAQKVYRSGIVSLEYAIT